MAPGILLDSTLEETKYYSESLKQKYHLSFPEAGQSNEAAANIPFHPSLDQYLTRVKEASSDQRAYNDFPSHWPRHVDGKMSWRGSDLNDKMRYVYHFTDADLEEIQIAVQHVHGLGVKCKDIDRNTFPLPTLGEHLLRASEQVYSNIGFMVLRGLNVDDYTADDIAAIFFGISSYIADKRGVQDRNGNVLKHLLDSGKEDSQVDLPFHTDITCDVVATLVRECSNKGGTTTLASSWTVYNELAATRPDLVHVLAKPNWPFDTFGRDPSYYTRALLYLTTPYSKSSKPILNFSRRPLTGHPFSPRNPSIPALTLSQGEALDAVHFTAATHQFKFATEKGDIRYINNMSLLHGREAFFDDPMAETDTSNGIEDGCLGVENPRTPEEQLSKRHLLRLWLSSTSTAATLPPPLKVAWARVFDDDERLTRWDVEPIYVSGVPMWRSNSSCD